MAKVEIYARPLCGFCYHAKQLLDGKGVVYDEYNVWTEAGKKEEMISRSGGGTTVPQIFIDDRHIGGCNELVALNQSGELDALLGGSQ